MSLLPLFMPCAAGVESWLADEVQRITRRTPQPVRGGVGLDADWADVMRLNLHARLTQRVLLQLHHGPYHEEADLYEAAASVPWEDWFTPRESFKIELTAHQSPLKSLNFAALKIKDAVADRFRERGGVRPDVDTQWPQVRVFAHLGPDTVTLYIDSSGEPLFKRGWREDKGEAPLKETLAAAMIAASGWDATVPLYDPCCGSGTIVIEAAQIACNIAPGLLRKFAFEKMLPHRAAEWASLKAEAAAAKRASPVPIFGSDVAFRMVDFAQRNAQRAGVDHVVQLRGGDALQRSPPAPAPGTLLLNPPYDERIEA
ncbi:MAG: putative methylase, partial [Ramlibacter sp.]|uniref:THUMP domain-containing class I SAM-dependent RNA methyltransferase n=1 Tax=Ramlibacter sp. TaxID=1917967 RepID=UPI00261E8D4E